MVRRRMVVWLNVMEEENNIVAKWSVQWCFDRLKAGFYALIRLLSNEKLERDALYPPFGQLRLGGQC